MNLLINSLPFVAARLFARCHRAQRVSSILNWRLINPTVVTSCDILFYIVHSHIDDLSADYGDKIA
ncbi:hypothetical protein, partial [Caenibacillus caldisaponilyticus]|uniref:hypothetical protein n=1 Tax=Caenibacillus caldisaponilyticus TaxID=1674942 RepID=UPI001EE745C9